MCFYFIIFIREWSFIPYGKIKENTTVASYSLLNQEIVFSEDVALDERFPDNVPCMNSLFKQSVITVPICLPKGDVLCKYLVLFF